MRLLLIMMMVTFTLSSFANDVEVKLNTDGGFSVKSNDESEIHLKVENDGALLANLPYGEMYMYTTYIHPNGSEYVGWTLAIPGEMYNSEYVYFEDNAVSDRLVIGPNGAGLYYINLSGSINIPEVHDGTLILCLFKNDVLQEKFKHEITCANECTQTIQLTGLLYLTTNDYIDLRLFSSSSVNYFMKAVNLTIFRVSD